MCEALIAVLNIFVRLNLKFMGLIQLCSFRRRYNFFLFSLVVNAFRTQALTHIYIHTQRGRVKMLEGAREIAKKSALVNKAIRNNELSLSDN